MRIGQYNLSLELRSTDSSSTLKDPGLLKWFGFGAGGRSSAGVAVTPDTALKLSHIYLGVRLIAEGIASMPFGVYLKDGDKRQALPDHPLYPLIHDKASPFFTSYALREALISSAILRGGGFARIERDLNGRPVAFHYIQEQKVEPFAFNGKRWYKVDGFKLPIPDLDMIHIPGYGFDGLRAKSFVAYAADSLGVSLAAQDFGGKFFSNGANLGGILSTDKELDQEAEDRLIDSWNARYQGESGALGTAMLQDGMQYTRIGIAPNEAQFIETRQLGIEEGARWLNIPVSKLKSLEKSSYNSQEQQQIEWVMDALRPWAVKLEQEFNAKIFRASEIGTHYVRINLNGLLRGDLKSRAEYIKTLADRAALTTNEIRALDDLNPVDGGDVRYIAANMIPTDIASDFWIAKSVPGKSPELKSMGFKKAGEEYLQQPGVLNNNDHE